MNIANISTTRPKPFNSSVAPELNPTVPKAEKDSNTIPNGESVQAAQLRNEVILGLQIHSDQRNRENMFGIVLIPD